MEEKFQESKVEGRNAVLEAFRSGRVIDKLFVQEHCEDGPVRTILREAKKHDTFRSKKSMTVFSLKVISAKD